MGMRSAVMSDEDQMREAQVRAAIRVARKLGADADQLHDVMVGARGGASKNRACISTSSSPCNAAAP